MSQSTCPCCELLGTPPARVNFIITTGVPWHPLRYRIRQCLLRRGTDGIPINNHVDLANFESLTYMNDQLFQSTRSCSISATEKCCYGLSLTLLEGFDHTDAFIWNQFKKSMLSQLMVNAETEGTKTEPVSWVVIDDKRCLQREQLDFFFNLKKHSSSSRNYTVTIIFGIGDEQQLFENCILESINCHEYESSVYPKYLRQLKEFADYFNSSPTLQARTFFIRQNEAAKEEELRALLFELPAKVAEHHSRKNLFREHVREMLFVPRHRREVNDIDIFRSIARKQCEKAANECLGSVLVSLQDPNTAERAVRQVVRIVLIEFKSMSNEQQRVYEQKLMFIPNSREAKRSSTIAAQLTWYAIELFQRRDSSTIPLLYDIIMVLCTLGKHRHFCHDLFNFTPEIFLLSISLVSQRCYVLVLAGLRLCKAILDSDRLERKYALAYLTHDQEISQKMTAAILWLLTPFQSLKARWEGGNESHKLPNREPSSGVDENQCLQHAAILISHKQIQSLSLLLHGSVQHCVQITVDDVTRLADTIDILVDHRLSPRILNEKPAASILVSDLCTILYPLLQYGTSDVVSTLKSKMNLLNSLPVAIASLLVHGKELADPCIRFYTFLICSIFKDGKPEYLSETKQFVTLPTANGAPPTTRLPCKQEDVALDPNDDLIASYFQLHCAYPESLKRAEEATIDESDQYLQTEWTMFTQTKLKLDHARVKEENVTQQSEIARLRDELARTRTERDQLHINNLELSQSINKSRQIPVASTSVTSPLSPVSDSDVERNSAEWERLSPQNITKEQAEGFIKDIHRRRVTFSEPDMRKSICGSLKHLGSDLYSSSVHFLYELIQNAEDNVYDPTVTPCLRIVIDHDFILLSNNEQGLRACDVAALCTLAVSTKDSKEHIGEKGIGFKSVFAASNQPTLISHVWRFAFHVPGPDEMSYITPIWVSDETMLAKINDHIAAGPLETHLHLPLKLLPFTSEAEEFLDQVVQATDPCILINLCKLKKLEILDRRKKETLTVTKNVMELKIDLMSKSVIFEGFTFENLTASIVALETGVRQSNFWVYTANIRVPTLLEQRDTRVILAFPIEPEHELAYNVYCGLPVCHLGFNFLFNADFQLATNRESVRENVPFNELIRNHLSVLFVYILLHEKNVRDRMHYYCPSNTAKQIKHSPWWLRMVDRINELISKHFAALLNIQSGKTVRRLDADLASLVSEEQLFHCADIQIIGDGLHHFTSEQLQEYEMKPVSMVDVLNCFPDQNDLSNESRDKFYRWADAQDKDWWTRFYEQIDRAMTDELGTLLLTKPIFLLHRCSRRQYLPAMNVTPRGRYLTDDPSLQLWKRHMILLRYASQPERNALLKTKQMALLTDERLIQLIRCDHLQLSSSSNHIETTEAHLEEVWQDLAYLKSKLDLIGKSDRFLVSVRDSRRLVPIHDATLPTVLGVCIQSFLHDSNAQVIRFPYHSSSADDNLQWEHFFLALNCQKPIIRVPVDYDLSRLPLLRSFTAYPHPERAEVILSQQSTITQECLIRFPIRACANGLEQIYPVSTTFDKAIATDLPFLPQVDVPHDCRLLAKKLGVIGDYDQQACLTVLQVLSHQKSTDLALYTHWLGHLQLYVRQHPASLQTTEDLLACQIYLPDQQHFRSLKDLIIVSDSIEHRASIQLVSDYLNMPIISPSTNQIYWQFADLFGKLNCARAVNITNVFQAIQSVSRDRSLFHNCGDGITILTELGAEKVISLYQHLETLILKRVMESDANTILYRAVVENRHPAAPSGSREDLRWRFGLTSAEMSDKLQQLIGITSEYEQLPQLTSDRQLVASINSTVIYACLEEKIIQNLAKDVDKRFFVSPLIATTCPLVVATFNIDYVERRGQLVWIHKNNTMECVLANVTEIFRETLQDKTIEVLTVKNSNVNLLLSDLSPMRTVGEDPPANVDSYTFDSDVPFWVFGNIVVLNIGMVRHHWTKVIIARAALATLLHKRQLKPLEAAMVVAQQNITANLSFAPGDFARVASTGAQYFAYVDSVFPMANLSIESSPILLSSECDTPPDVGRAQTTPISMERIATDHLYRHRVQEQDHRTLLWQNSHESVEQKIVNNDAIVSVGINAEHFFFRYLQKEYGIDYVSPTRNWRSSNRQKLFPGCLQNIDDTLGYDFVLQDKREVFVKGIGASTKQCYFEVKGISDAFDVRQTRFHISENERNMCKAIASNQQQTGNEAYFIVLVEHCLEPDKIALSAVINWSENFELIHMSPNSYLCYIVLPSARAADSNNTQPSVTVKQLAGPGAYIPPHKRK